MRFLRVEHPETGAGPYQAPHAPHYAPGVVWDTYGTDRHPSPHLDFGSLFATPSYKNYDVPGARVFGFRDEAQLTDWFDRHERMLLGSFGFDVVEVEVKDQLAVKYGYSQVVYDKLRAREVRRAPAHLWPVRGLLPSHIP